MELKPDDAAAHSSLAGLLQQLGRYGDALPELRRYKELAREEDKQLAARRLCDAEQMAALAPRLPEVIAGKAKAADPRECLMLAKMCQYHKKVFAAAARLYAEAFTADPNLAEGLDPGCRYDAACAAALAGCGQGNDAANLDDTERLRLRRQALDWLTAEFAAWTRVADKPANHAQVRRLMLHWRKDADFACVRGDAAIEKLPEAERVAWKKLWADVGTLLRRCQEQPAAKPEDMPPKSGPN